MELNLIYTTRFQTGNETSVFWYQLFVYDTFPARTQRIVISITQG